MKKYLILFFVNIFIIISLNCQINNLSIEDKEQEIPEIRRTTTYRDLIVFSIVDSIRIDETVNIPFYIDRKTFKFVLCLGIISEEDLLEDLIKNLSLFLTSPSGKKYEQQLEDWMISNDIKINNSEEGKWIATITNISDIENPIIYCIYVSASSESFVKFTYTNHYQRIMHPMLASITLDSDFKNKEDTSVKMIIKDESWEKEIPFYNKTLDNNFSNYIFIDNEILIFPQPDFFYYYPYVIYIEAPAYNFYREIGCSFLINQTKQIQLPNITRTLHNGWNWIGYPHLQRDNEGISFEFANMSLDPFLTKILTYQGEAFLENNIWKHYGFSSLESKSGYKLFIQDIDNVNLAEFGTITDTLSTIQINQNQWNWITYPYFENANPLEALSDIKDKIHYILGEKWSMKKVNNLWIYDGTYSPYLKYGDTILIKTNEDCSLIWQHPKTKITVSDSPKTNFFTYQDKPEYETLMINSIIGNPIYDEIGVFQNNTCIGARVYGSYPIQILTYPKNNNDPLNIMLYSKNKKNNPIAETLIKTETSTEFVNSIQSLKDGFRNLTLKIK
ncbi:MAG: hypothetical protein M0Q94_11620 [Candidatus Cloacimonetes bacterium]|nr:hypothetical protein [Candidatus Cloacimonadota bacterium]